MNNLKREADSYRIGCIAIMLSALIVVGIVVSNWPAKVNKGTAKTYEIYSGISYKDAVTECKYDVTDRPLNECIADLTKDLAIELDK